MEILVCARRVPDTSENEIELNAAGNDIERDELVYSVNEADNYAVEEALQIRDRVGGNVTVVTVDGEDGEEILRRQLAMGANQSVLISDDAFNCSDGKGVAAILKAFVDKGHYDLILTGVQADDGAAQVGGMLAAMLDYPFASLVNSIAVEDGKLRVSREIEGGNREINEIDLPCVLSIQTGINEPRYVGMRGIRQVASVLIPNLAILTGWGPDFDLVCKSLTSSFCEVWKVASQDLAYPNAEVVRQALVRVLPPDNIVLVPHDHFGIDLSPGLSIKLNSAFVSDVLAIEGVEGNLLKLVRQELGGQVSTHVQCDISSGAVINVRPGAFKAQPTAVASGVVLDRSSGVGTLATRRRYLETIVAEAGDVDITRHSLLVSIGRGIQEKDNIVLAEELAEILGAAVSCSRPVVDAKWMAKSRQVGSSGKTVKPKVYMACGISGAFQHLAGIKGSPFLIAINKNPKAPIFQVADVGIVDDLLEFLPELTNKAREFRGVAAK